MSDDTSFSLLAVWANALRSDRGWRILFVLAVYTLIYVSGPRWMPAHLLIVLAIVSIVLVNIFPRAKEIKNR